MVRSEQGVPSVLLAKPSGGVSKDLKSSRGAKTLTRGDAALGITTALLWSPLLSQLPAHLTQEHEVLLLKLVFVPSRCLQILPPTLCRGWGLSPLYLCPSSSSWDTQELSQRRTGHNEVSCAVLVCAASVPAGHPTPVPSHPAAGLPGMYFFLPKDLGFACTALYKETAAS